MSERWNGERARADGAPLVSVLMAVRNAGPYLRDSVDSILRQTLRAFEFLIVDDASTDDSAALLEEFARRDDRLRLFRNVRALHVGPSLNFLAGQARSPVCARMDADDVADPDRLRRQWSVLTRRVEVCLVGTLWEGVDRQGRVVRPRNRWALLRGSSTPPFPAGSVMFRREAFDAVQGYRDLPWEDVDLAIRMSSRGRVEVLPEALYRYRFHTGSASQGHERVAMIRSLAHMYRQVGFGEGHGRGAPETSSPGVGNGIREGLTAAYYLEASRLWAGEAPMSAGLDDLGKLGWDRVSLKLRVLRACGAVSPRLLRAGLATAIRLLDLTAGWVLRTGEPVGWPRS